MVRGKYRGGGRRGGAPRPSKDASDSGSSEDEFTRKKIVGQASNVGMLPPSSSDEDSDDSGAKGGQNPNVGELPPSDSDSDSEEEDAGKAAGKTKPAIPAAQPEAARRRKGEEGPSEAQMREDMERLELIKKRREEQRLKRIADEGWDRFAPVTETNRPPLPGDYVKKAEAE